MPYYLFLIPLDGSSLLKRSNVIVYLVLFALFAAGFLLAFFNRGDAELRRALEENREFLILVDGGTVATVNLQMLLDLDPQEFTTTYSTSISAPRETALKGVELRLLLESLDIDILNAASYVISGLDSYYSPLTREEVDAEGVVYICYSMDGQILKTQSEGGFGPFMMVIRGSAFAQRWCKYVEAVDIRQSNN